MSNLQQFFGGAGGGGSVPLRGLVPFPHDAPNKIVQGSQVFIRSGQSEVVDYDPSLQSWVDNNVMFTNTQFLPVSEVGTAIRSSAVATDGAGKWMAGGWQNVDSNTLPRLYYSADDGVTWVPLAGITVGSFGGVQNIRSGGNGVWIVTVERTSTIQVWRTTNNGANWTDITVTALGSSADSLKALETDRNGVWLAAFGNATTFQRRSADNGATWSTVNFPQNGHMLRTDRNGVWLAGLSDTTSTGFHTHISVSTDNGLTWSAAWPVNMTDFRFVQGVWVGFYQNGLYRPATADFKKWDVQTTAAVDWLTDNTHVGGTGFSMSAGLDGSLWLHTSSNSYRSSDAGVTWTKIDLRFTQIAAAANRRTVGISNGNNAAGLPPGICTGRPAAGIPYANVGRQVNNNDTGRRSVYYVRTK